MTHWNWIKIRLFIVFALKVGFNVWVTVAAFHSLHQYKANHSSEDDGKVKATFISLIIFTVVGGLTILLTPLLLVWERTKDKIKKSRINILSLSFVCGTMVQYGIALNFSHLNAADYVAASNPLGSAYNQTESRDCVTLDHDDIGTKKVFYALLMTLPLLVINSMIYPYPEDQGKDKKISTSLLIGLSAFDIIDMAELSFSDVGCIQNYGAGWPVLFYLALGMSAVMTTFYWGLEQVEDEPKNGDFVATFMNWVFNDVLFLVVRCKVMYVQGHAYFGLIFVIKESLSVVVRGLIFGYYYLHKKLF